MASHPDTKIDCSKVYVKRSSFATTETEFDGAFAAVPIKKGALHSTGPRREQRERCHRILDAELCLVDVVSFCLRNLTLLHYVFTGELVEKGVMRRLPEGFDGNKSPYVFTWSNERPNKVRNYPFRVEYPVYGRPNSESEILFY
jgi:hypothetical protein